MVGLFLFIKLGTREHSIELISNSFHEGGVGATSSFFFNFTSWLGIGTFGIHNSIFYEMPQVFCYHNHSHTRIALQILSLSCSLVAVTRWGYIYLLNLQVTTVFL